MAFFQGIKNLIFPVPAIATIVIWFTGCSLLIKILAVPLSVAAWFVLLVFFWEEDWLEEYVRHCDESQL